MQQHGSRISERPAHTLGATLRTRLGNHERSERSSPCFTLRFVAVEPRQQVQITSLLKLAGPFATSRWEVCEQDPADALVIGLGMEEGRMACQANRLDAMALPALLLGTPEQARDHVGGEPASVLLLSPPFRHLSLFYCLDMLAGQCKSRHGAARKAGREAATQLRALVVDDSPTVRAQLSNVIMRIGMQCELADGAAAALAKLEGSHYDLIVVDVLMPDMDGYKLTREIKRGRAHKHTPVIILTSQSSPFDRARGALAGCDIYLTKPVGLKAFYEAATKALRKSMAVDDLSLWLTEPGPARPLPGDAPHAHRHASSHAPASPGQAHSSAGASFTPVVKLQSR